MYESAGKTDLEDKHQARYQDTTVYDCITDTHTYTRLTALFPGLPHQHLTTQFFKGRMPFLPPNQQHQSTEGI